MSRGTSDIVESTRECKICWDNDQFPSIPPTGTCLHPPQVCGVCLRKHTSHILRHETRNRCLEEGCISEFSHVDLQKWADPVVWQRYFIADLAKDEHFVQCLRGDCHFGQFHVGGDKEPIVKCYRCGAKQCFIHRVPWHMGVTCAQWKRSENNENNRKSIRIILKETRNCPSCKVPIHKIEGCDLMTCKCTFRFCFACGVPHDRIRRGNHHHKRLCPHYASKKGEPGDRPRWWEFWKGRWWHRARWEQR